MTVWKYTLEIGTTELEIPLGAAVLSVQVQRGEPCLWCLVNPQAQKGRRTFEAFGTGQQVPTGRRHLGSFQLLDGDFVGHVFEVMPDDRPLSAGAR